MHKLIEYVCDELEELEHKADKDGNLSTAELEYGDMLARFKKNLLKGEKMMEGGEYSMDDDVYSRRYPRMYENHSYGGRRRDAYGRYVSRGYSMDNDEMVDELHALMEKAPDDKTRKEFEKFIRKMEEM